MEADTIPVTDECSQYVRFHVTTQAIYDDVQDLRPAAGGWKPLNVCVRLGPQMGGSTDGSAPVHVQTTLHVICPSKYPRL